MIRRLRGLLILSFSIHSSLLRLRTTDYLTQCPSGNETIKKRIVYYRVSIRGHLRPGLKRILELAMRGAVEEVMVAHRDRIARFGFELADWILQQCVTRLLVLNTTAGGEQEELVNDLISLIHVFSAKSYGSSS
jgi:hypothetical protein